MELLGGVFMSGMKAKSHESYFPGEYICCIIPLAPGKLEWNIGKVIFKLILMIHAWGISYEIVLFHNSFSPSGEQPEQRALACRQKNQLPVV